MVLNKCSGTTGRPCAKKNEYRLRLHIFHRINSKWIIDLFVKCKIKETLKGNIRKNLDDLKCGSDFLDTTPKARSMKELISWTSLKQKTFWVSWVAYSVKHLPLGLASDHDLLVREFEPHIGLCADSTGPAWDCHSLSGSKLSLL